MHFRRINNKALTFCLSVLIFSCSTRSPQLPTEIEKPIPVSVTFHKNTIKKVGDFKAGDNWCQTWAADDNVYAMLDDGFGFNGGEFRYNNIPVRINGEPDSFKVTELTRYPAYEFGGGWYGYGIISVDSILYTFLSITNTNGFSYFQGNKLFYSDDFGQTWFNHTGNLAEDEQYDINEEKVFFWHEDPVTKNNIEGYAFSWISFCQNGKNNAHADAIADPYIYMYSPEPNECWKLNMARVKRDKFRDKNSFEYFEKYGQNNQPVWTFKIKNRGVIYEFPKDDAWGWYSWQPSVVWNEELGFYIMVNYGSRYGTTKGKLPGNYWNSYMHDETCSIGFWFSENPWGPWKQIYYDEYFYPGEENDRAYQLKLSPKWITNDGKTMYLIWSDARDSWTTNYLWNQMKITLIVK